MPRMTTATSIYERLHASILALEIKPRMALQEKLLADEFGVSRTPVREALIRLADAGLVEIFPQHGTFVAPIPLAAIPEAVIVRKALEGAAVELAAAVATREDVERLDRIIARQWAFAGLGDTNEFHEGDEAFHEAIAGISGHPGIWKLVRTSKVQIDRARRLTLPGPGRMNHVVDEHSLIRDAIAHNDVAGARTAMTDHLGALILDIGKLAHTHPDFFG